MSAPLVDERPRCGMPCLKHDHACDRSPRHTGFHRDVQQKGDHRCEWDTPGPKDYPALMTALRSARAEEKQLRARVAELSQYEAGIKHLTTTNGAIDMDLTLAHDLMRIYVAAFAEILNEQDAPNFVELMFKLAGTDDRYTVTIRRPNGKTPGEVLGKVRADLAALTDIVAGTALLGADDAVGMVRALTEHLAASGEISADQAERVYAGLNQQQDTVTPDTVVQISANLERYITERAGVRAEAALVRAKQEADRRVGAVCGELGAKLEQRTAERDEAVREMREEARTADALRKNRDQLNDELTAARRGRPRRSAQRWERDVDRRTVRRLIDAWEDGADPFDTLRQIKRVVADGAAAGEENGQAEPEVTVPPGTPPAAMRCPHRDFDDPTRCPTCHP